MENIIICLKNSVLPLLGCVLVFAACSEGDHSCASPGEDVLAIDRVSLTLGDTRSSLGASTRAVAGFAVNTADDPTYSFDEKLGWTLDLALYKYQENNIYPEGQGTFTYNDPYWTTTSTLYMPHYLMQAVEAKLYPASWVTGGETIATDQRSRTAFIEQDILEQNGDNTYQTAPAHYLEVEMRHSNSMIDFILAEVNPADIASVTVEAGGDVYQPYKVTGVSPQEYLVILPKDTPKPVIRVETNAGAHYSKELAIPAMKVNTCYHVRLIGLQLVLEGLTVSSWSYGEAVGGDYSSVTSYPTFRGPIGLTVKVYYSSDTNQEMTFNEKGEAVVKPAGRTIIAIESEDGRYDLPEPYTIRTQIIDLNPFIDEIGN